MSVRGRIFVETWDSQPAWAQGETGTQGRVFSQTKAIFSNMQVFCALLFSTKYQNPLVLELASNSSTDIITLLLWT